MLEVYKYQFQLVVGGNAKVRIYLKDGTNKVFTIAADLLPAYDCLLKQPDVMYDPVNNLFVTRDRFENTLLKSF